MIASRQMQKIVIVLGDLFLFYASLILTLSLRYLEFPDAAVWAIHKWPFFLVYDVWILVFYIAGLYELENLGSRKIIFRNVLTTMMAAGVIAVLIFYLVPSFQITPKTNLLIDIIFVTLFAFLWRQLFWYITLKANKTKILFFGKTKESDELVSHLKTFPQLGYEPAILISNPQIMNLQNEIQSGIKNIAIDNNLADVIKEYDVHLIVASKDIMENRNAARRFYEILPLGVSTVSFSNFYEVIMGKIPTSSINESWFLENLVEINKAFYKTFKRMLDVIFAVILGLPTFVILPVMAVAVKSESEGPVFYRQKRVGANGKVFEIIKFRTMVKEAEKRGAQWSQTNDKRITKVGNVLRKTRLDELPQLWNILKNDMSFIGPRPERPEFVENLEKQIPYYKMRYLIKPGVSGWAQINFPYGSSVEDAMKKLQYDLYYIKNRSFIIDLSIVLRTAVTIIVKKIMLKEQ